jgi:hypothetical protein
MTRHVFLPWSAFVFVTIADRSRRRLQNTAAGEIRNALFFEA